MRWRVLAPSLLWLLLGPVAAADTPVLADVLQVVVLDREVLSIDARGGSQLRERLELGEEVRWTGARGKVAVVLTDRRLLAVATASAAWQEVRYRRTEAIPQDPLLGRRVALASTASRVIGFDGGSGNLVESGVGPQESLLEGVVGDNVAVMVTDRRALGLSPFRGGFFEISLRLSERVEALTAVANSATLQTDQRLLIFRAPTGTWEERNLRLR